MMLASLLTTSDLTLEEKVGQVLMPHVRAEVVSKDAQTLIEETHVGGIIYYNWANGLTSFSQVKTLSVGLQALSKKIPLLIAADQEGGVVTRLNQGFTIFPGNKALAMTGDSNLAQQSAYVTGKEMLAAGVNMNLAPVVDVNSNPRNPVIGIRSFGNTTETVVEFGRRALQGYHSAGVITCLKHFPGHGDVASDSHEALPVIRKTKEELEEVEFVPFRTLAPQADTIMTAHLLIPALDPDHCSTVSKKTLSHLREMGFEGVIISDSLVMEGVLKLCGSVDEAAIQALNAGCDILILGGKALVGTNSTELTLKDIQRVHKSLVDAVKIGRIAEERLNDAVTRVLKLKEKYLVSHVSSDFTLQSKLAEEIATHALRIIKTDPFVLKTLQQKKIVIFAPEALKAAVEQTTLLTVGKENTAVYFPGFNSEVEEIQLADAYIVCSYNAWKNPNQQQLINDLIASGKPVIVMAVRDPLDAELFPKASSIFTTFSPTAPSIQAAVDQLTVGNK